MTKLSGVVAWLTRSFTAISILYDVQGHRRRDLKEKIFWRLYDTHHPDPAAEITHHISPGYNIDRIDKPLNFRKEMQHVYFDRTVKCEL